MKDLLPSILEEEALNYPRTRYRERRGVERELAMRLGNHHPLRHCRVYRNNITQTLALADFKVAFLEYARAMERATGTANLELYWRRRPTLEFLKGEFQLSAELFLMKPRKRK